MTLAKRLAKAEKLHVALARLTEQYNSALADYNHLKDVRSSVEVGDSISFKRGGTDKEVKRGKVVGVEQTDAVFTFLIYTQGEPVLKRVADYQIINVFGGDYEAD